MTTIPTVAVPTVTALHGHTSPDTAFVVDDYPYGRSLRCKKRYWVETAVKGAKKGQQRLVGQTTNPKVVGERWNNPHPGQYYGLVVMYQIDDDGDEGREDGHVKAAVADFYGVRPSADAWFQLIGLIDQMTNEQRDLYNVFLAVSKQQADTWARWEALLTALVDHRRAEGAFPTRADNGMMFGRHVGQAEYEVAVAWVERHTR